jgi:cytochrome c553
MRAPMSGGAVRQAAAALVAVGTMMPPAQADMIVTEGMQPWEHCAECHNLDGISVMAKFPKLAGQRPDYIRKQVRDFSHRRRSNDGGQMQAVASDISDEDLARAADYFGGLAPPPPDASMAKGSAEWQRGAALYRDGDAKAGIERCRSCHESAERDHPQGPYLTAQHSAYLAKQLRDWRSGARTNDPSHAMPALAAKLSEEDISALAAFLASAPRQSAEPGSRP